MSNKSTKLFMDVVILLSAIAALITSVIGKTDQAIYSMLWVIFLQLRLQNFKGGY